MHPALLLLAGAGLLAVGGKKKKRKKTPTITATATAVPIRLMEATDATSTGMVGHGRTTTSTRPPGAGTSGGGRAFKDAPTPGYWYKVKSRDLRPIRVKGPQGSTIAVEIANPAHSLAWRAYVGVSDQRLDKSSSLSKWVGLSGILGPRQGFDDAVSLLPEIMSGVSGGISGDWKSVGQSAANMITSIWSGVKDKQDAAGAVVGDFVNTFNGNMVSAPMNAMRVDDPFYGWVLNLAVGDRVYIPLPGEYYTPEPSKPNG